MSTFKRPRSLMVTLAFGMTDRMVINLRLGTKSKPRRIDANDVRIVEVGMGEAASAHSVGARLGEMAKTLLDEMHPDDKFGNALVVDACAAYGDDVISGTAPDRTFDVRSGMLMPMNRQRAANDMMTLTMETVYENVAYG